MSSYNRSVFYYETDQMGIAHHSNYIRWMEEARLHYMKQINLDYKLVENAGIIMPVVSVQCKYIASAHFDDEICISVSMDGFTGVRAFFSYDIKRTDGILLATGKSEHCFLSLESRRPINLKRHMPDYCEKLKKHLIRTEVL